MRIRTLLEVSFNKAYFKRSGRESPFQALPVCPCVCVCFWGEKRLCLSVFECKRLCVCAHFSVCVSVCVWAHNCVWVTGNWVHTVPPVYHWHKHISEEAACRLDRNMLLTVSWLARTTDLQFSPFFHSFVKSHWGNAGCHCFLPFPWPAVHLAGWRLSEIAVHYNGLRHLDQHTMNVVVISAVTGQWMRHVFLLVAHVQRAIYMGTLM